MLSMVTFLCPDQLEDALCPSFASSDHRSVFVCRIVFGELWNSLVLRVMQKTGSSDLS